MTAGWYNQNKKATVYNGGKSTDSQGKIANVF